MKAVKIYKHTFNYFRNVVETVEIEVEEKPKTYVVVGRQKGVRESRVSKDDIGKLDRYWDRQMFMLSPDKKPYINSLIADKENEINRLKDSLEKAIEIKDLLAELLRKEDEGEMKVENLTKYICDVCGKIEYAKKDKSSPMQEIRLPMKYYDETGRNQGLTNQRIDICSECFKALESDLSKHYYMSYCAYIGVEIKRHPTEK